MCVADVNKYLLGRKVSATVIRIAEGMSSRTSRAWPPLGGSTMSGCELGLLAVLRRLGVSIALIDVATPRVSRTWTNP